MKHGQNHIKCISVLFTYHVICLTTRQQPFSMSVLHIARPGATSFNFHCPLIPLRLSSDCLRLLPRIPVTSVLPSVSP